MRDSFLSLTDDCLNWSWPSINTWSSIHSFHVHPILWDSFDRINTQTALNTFESKTETQKRKLAHLITQQLPKPRTLKPTTVVHNFSDTPISTIATQALAKGFNYSVTPSHTPIETIICQTEEAISHLPSEDAEIVRQDVARVLRNSKPPTPNISQSERKALKELQANPDLVILPADKGNATVILNTSSYIDKLSNLINTPDYKPQP
ncbi:uncharacterized protein LOC126891156 [Diabrotica virgifera virgifera]|uniref:Uncharacterized protein n=1 Tax=Diabrotica virgifera virgifera TaxID=50390 RepID=A0ABM5L1H4_DIAVI|nr:uncharacterized protein LOC126891156 [Diabrotica virgifera virgifera]